MTSLVIYSLILSAVLLLFWGAYKILRIDMSASPLTARICLMTLTVLSPLIALIPFVMPQAAPETIWVRPVVTEITAELSIAALPAPTSLEPTIDWAQIIAAIYAIGAILWFCRLLVSIGTVMNIVRKSAKAGDNLRLNDNPDIVPFTWGRWIVMSKSDYKNHGPMLMTHEQSHLRGAHWVDLLVINLIGCFTWYCPAALLIRRELTHTHEFEADKSVLNHGFSAPDYQMLLIEKATGRKLTQAVAPSINQSYSLKKRIIKMLTQHSSASAHKRVLMLIPAVVIAVTGTAALAALRPAPAPIVKVLPAEDAPAAETPVTETPAVEPQPQVSAPAVTAEDSIYTIVDVKPEFKGGDSKLYQWLALNIRYPEKAAINNIQGTVLCSVVIEKDGSVSNVNVIKSIDPDLDAEAIRVLKALPAFNPGQIAGKPVRTAINMPITFKMIGAGECIQPDTIAAPPPVSVSATVQSKARRIRFGLLTAYLSKLILKSGLIISLSMRHQT